MYYRRSEEGYALRAGGTSGRIHGTRDIHGGFEERNRDTCELGGSWGVEE